MGSPGRLGSGQETPFAASCSFHLAAVAVASASSMSFSVSDHPVRFDRNIAAPARYPCGSPRTSANWAIAA